MTPAAPPGARRVIRTYNGFKLFTGLLWWLPVFYVYQRHSGLSETEIFRIQSIYYLAFCLLEIPTGALADRFDYRRFVQIGATLLTAANLVPVLWPSYRGFLAHFLLIALANSLVSGAGSAYLYEWLQRGGAVAAYQQAEGSGRAYALTGRIVCLPAAGVLMEWRTPSPYVLSALCCAVGVLLALRLPALPPGPGDSTGPDGDGRRKSWSPRDQLAAGRMLRRSPLLALVMAQGVAVFTLVRVGQTNLFQPVLAAKDLPLAGFGVMMAGTTLFELAGAARSGWLRRLGEVRAVFLLTAVMALALALLVPAGLIGAAICLCVFSLAAGLVFPIQRQLVNGAIPGSAHRATLLSTESLIDRAVCALVVLALGGYLSRGQMNQFLVHVAIGTILLMGVLAVLVHRVRRAGPDDPGERPAVTKENAA
ncbi:MFS transporter [Streptomyces katsurahamanus]|uniref:MFS transporter n=1 Tax=Streptomyces katsurahamanus TaxID=2577098 RepID=A0ABW9P3L3_9ACTN|nr:MFS transporter [Streptomyces katsurahamanus]MQS39684.1 MFS transporter [Streptomyces katsurahamanus]